MHWCAEETMMVEAAIASVPVIGLAVARVRARLAARLGRCAGRPACSGHAPDPGRADEAAARET